MDKYYLNEAIEYTCDVLDISKPKLRTSMLREDRGKTARYYITDRGGRLFIDLKSFTDMRQLYFTLFHELFHHFQAIKCGMYKSQGNSSSIDFDEEHIDFWAQELSNYKANGVEGYDDQYLELDSNAFGIYMSKVLWNLDVPYNSEAVDRDKLIECVVKIKKAIPAQDVLGIAEDYDLLDLGEN